MLIATDVLHRYNASVLHQHLDAFPLIMIGLSYITLQFKSARRVDIKRVLLGVAFLLWGGEQLLPPSQLSTFMDEGAVTIFVLDLSVIVWGHLNKTDANGSF